MRRPPPASLRPGPARGRGLTWEADFGLVLGLLEDVSLVPHVAAGLELHHGLAGHAAAGGARDDVLPGLLARARRHAAAHRPGGAAALALAATAGPAAAGGGSGGAAAALRVFGAGAFIVIWRQEAVRGCGGAVRVGQARLRLSVGACSAVAPACQRSLGRGCEGAWLQPRRRRRAPPRRRCALRRLAPELDAAASPSSSSSSSDEPPLLLVAASSSSPLELDPRLPAPRSSSSCGGRASHDGVGVRGEGGGRRGAGRGVPARARHAAGRQRGARAHAVARPG
jgi:hypothetical protein